MATVRDLSGNSPAPTNEMTIDDAGSDPATGALIWTPVDNQDIITPRGRRVVSRAISFAANTALAVIDAEGNSLTIPSGMLAPGIMHPLRVRRILDTGTDATQVMVYW